ncbi:heme-dependent oxidative N-demethylase subunit alpha family protein [Caldimonas tepidiphila]|uniref:heme-dependent oxidative N-demethylase subunit alpha family protein n=1 Tax=Caldimonas tepidiphila TaxID=2315841 RepID=UPI000E5A3FB2|nr:heme-dependent oxidative N-demethylase subunit alpha family protein [Caldimonas tepidiphila]
MAFDFDAAVTAPFRMQPGLRRMAEGARALVPLHFGSPVLAAKLAVLERHAGDALLCAPGFDAAPAVGALAREAERQAPGALAGDEGELRALGWRLDREDRVHPDACAGPIPDAGEHARIGALLRALPAPLRRLALPSLALHEDFAVVDGARATLPCLAVCLPSHWDPAEKLGRRFAEVHAPVADNRLLLAAGEHLMRLVCGPQRWERFVWNVTTLAALDAHPRRQRRPHWTDDPDPQAVAAQAFFRTEHQTFLPLPGRQQALFMIHVEVRPLRDALQSPARAAALRDALATMSDAVLAYRGLAPVRDRLLAWLDVRSRP